MLYIAYFIIVRGRNIEKMFCKILLPSASPPRRLSTPSNACKHKIGKKRHKYGLKHALHSLDGHFT